MFNYNQNNENTFVNVNTGDIAVPRTFINHVFSWMAIALGITAFFAYYFSTNTAFISSLLVQTEKGMGMSGLGWVVMLAPLAFVLIMSFGFNKFSARCADIIICCILLPDGHESELYLSRLYGDINIPHICCNGRNFRCYGCCRLYHKNGSVKIWRYYVHGPYRYYNCKPCKYVHEKPNDGLCYQHYWRTCIYRTYCMGCSET